MATVETRGVKKYYGDMAAVNGVDLAHQRRRVSRAARPLGLRQDTLLRMIAGFETPTRGRAADRRRSGERFAAAGAENRHGLPELRPLSPHDGVQEYRLSLKGAARSESADPAKGRVGRCAFRHRPFAAAQATRAFRRRAPAGGAARALVREPAVFLLDEPLSNLDAQLRASARDELQQFQRRIGTTTIYVTHDQVEAMGLGDRIAVMRAGTVRQIGTPQEIYDEPADTFVAAFRRLAADESGAASQNYILGFRPEQFSSEGKPER